MSHGASYVEAGSATDAAPTVPIPVLGRTARAVPTGDARPYTTTSLTSLRWFAALAVFCHHNFASFGALSAVAFSGYTAVAFFFVLSGFILTWSGWGRTQTARSFWRRRFARVFPSHFATWLVLWPVVGLLASTNIVGESLSSLFLVQAWVPDERVFFGWNGPSWSLSCEFFFYALFPAALAVLLRLRTRTIWLLVAAMWAASAVVELLAGFSFPAIDHYVYVLPPVRFAEFLAGIATAVTLRRGWRPRVWGCGLVLAASTGVAAFAACVVAPDIRGPVSAAAFWGFPAVIVLSLELERRSAGYRAVMSSRVLLLLGELSFCFYLVHKLAGKLMAVLGVPEGPPQLASSLAVSLVAAFALNRVVERPAERALRTARPRRRTATHAQA